MTDPADPACSGPARLPPGDTSTGGGPGSDLPDESLSAAFWSVARMLRRSTAQSLAPWDVTPSQVRALSVLGRHGAVRLGTLAEHLHIAARSATEVVDGLQGRGLVQRHPDPDDRRATVVSLTGAGDEAVAAIGAARSAEADRFFAALDDRDRAELDRILRILRTAAGDPAVGQPAP